MPEEYPRGKWHTHISAQTIYICPGAICEPITCEGLIRYEQDLREELR